MNVDPSHLVHDVERLAAAYGDLSEASIVKETDHVTEVYRRLIEASPFVVLATAGPEGLDASPRGDRGQVVHIEDERTLILPDRRGNNRIDSLRNVVRDPRVALLFLIPGSGTTLRVNGTAVISLDPALLSRFTADGKPPRSAMIVSVETIYFQCARAVIRAGLWDETSKVEPGAIPTPGEILSACTEGRLDGTAYDREWPARAAASMW
jgi:PPOX class probable FMN-dependent enzyme